ncbi:magnesium transporter CorA family protein [Meiothermus granaticius]|uniref:Cobalt/magnesium transport protein CorA n=1 Tax=Meiothermus granaticius NBRC 107808 TaxID=1227551 RepID=A0A399FCS0_9DEIN|nr:magnesium transporter CorA family protein [Meiothermus granaticius]MCL6525780.1 magnesium transporter CorA family protein [Thermaceae bacterium]RIH92822.1 Cobalt/magnesium transport protein CorA [Meiothermus granaticius NBRC 107808]GEM85536.1 zinc transporter ZntB [Meiothermus granaticius NBRC 107808]
MLRIRQLSTGAPCGPVAEGVWVDVETPTPEELETLKKTYPLNPLALADAQEIGHWSRFEQYPEHLFLVFRTLEAPDKVRSRTERVSYFYYPDRQVLLTWRNEPVEYLEDFWQRFYPVSATALWHRLLDRGVETFFTHVEGLQERLEDLEEEALDRDGADFPRLILLARRRVVAVRRLASQAREALLHVERIPLLGSDAYLFRDLTDRMGRVYEGLDAARDELSSMLDVNLSTQNNRLNRVVQRLTVLSALFLPLALWTGIFGTNVKLWVYELPFPVSTLFLWGGLVVIATGLALWMKRNHWW